MWLPVLCLLLAAPDDIRAVLDRQSADWNRGDIEAFMRGYDDSPQTAFVSKDGVRKGYAAILARYRRNYASREKMGTLRFTEIDIRPLGSNHAVATGKYSLDRTAAGGGPASGWFSLVFVKTPAQWKVVLDHTSSTQ